MKHFATAHGPHQVMVQNAVTKCRRWCCYR